MQVITTVGEKFSLNKEVENIYEIGSKVKPLIQGEDQREFLREIKSYMQSLQSAMKKHISSQEPRSF